MAWQAVESSIPGEVLDSLTSATNATGWSVPSGGAMLVLGLARPVSAKTLRVMLTLQNADAGSSPLSLTLTATTDELPRLAGSWKPMFPTTFGASQGRMTRQGERLLLDGSTAVADVAIDAGLPADGITGLRIEVFSKAEETHRVVLKLLRIERGNTPTTNVALGCPVDVIPPGSGDMPGGFLTDGRPETMVQGSADAPGAPQRFVIDLKRQCELDHLNLRLKSGSLRSAVMPALQVELYETNPTDGGPPVWQARPHAQLEASSLANSEPLLVIRAAMGDGRFTGRYVRITLPEHDLIPLQIAEFEAYETMVPLGVTMIAKGQSIRAKDTLAVPDGVSWMTFDINYPPLADPVTLGRHWRIVGFHEGWLSGTSSGAVESRCPPPGEYEFQAQIRHSDGIWCDAVYRMPLIVPVPFWQRAWARGTALIAAIVVTAGLAWMISRRVMARRVVELERRNELSNERARIARDMHDAVGSQLTQLAVLHEIVAEELGLDDDARSRLRQLTDTARASVAALDAVVWAVNPGNDNLANMAGYLTQVAHGYLVPLGIACRQDVPREWPERAVSSHTRHQFHLAMQEALQNVVKHARATEVTITLRHKDGRFTATIADNGIGLPADLGGIEKSGLENMHTRLVSLGGHCRVQSRPGGGTVVELQIPIPP